MIRLARLAPLAFALGAITTLDACRRKPTPEPVPVTNADSIARERARQDSIRLANEAAAARERARQDSIRLANEAAERELASMRTALTASIRFDYDQDDLRDDARATLEAKLPILNANPGLRLRIAGHADERGSEEYNLALGQKRAASVQRWFAERGIDAGRFELVSYGEERPVCTQSDESCYAQNRRAEFEVTAGGANLVRPRP
jgi:peptidoglycan-associated lipoprotein